MRRNNGTTHLIRQDIIHFIKHNVRQYTMIIALPVIWIVFSFLTDFIFLTPRNLSNLFVQSTTTDILAIGMVLVIVAGHFDLSVGSVLGFTGAVAAELMIKLHWGVIPAIAATLVTGLLIGTWHGFWIAYKKVPSLIVTLASMLIFKGAIIGITGGQTMGMEMAPLGIANAFKTIGQGYLPKIVKELPYNDLSLYLTVACIIIYIFFDLRKRSERIRYGLKVLPIGLQILKMSSISAIIGLFCTIMVFYLGIPYPVLLVASLVLLFTFIADKTTLGRHLYAIGGNPEAAKLSGINVEKTTMMLFMIMGVMASIAGIVYTARLNAATTSAGQNNIELDAIASAVIGGTSLMGGQGTIFGALIGALILASLDNGMSMMNMDITFQYIIKGLILLFSVWVDISSRKKM